jgi:hypothetical protein
MMDAFAAFFWISGRFNPVGTSGVEKLSGTARDATLILYSNIDRLH